VRFIEGEEGELVEPNTKEERRLLAGFKAQEKAVGTMMTESAVPLAGFGVVPDVGDFDFDLGALDTFTDMDIDMESFNLIDDAGTSGDPFGNLSFEQSLNLVDLTGLDNASNSGDLSILDDFDVKEPIKQDCMWSSFQDATSPIRRSPLHIKQQRRRRDSGGAAGLTPPSSYINDHLRTFDTPLPSDEESSEEVDVVSPPAVCSRVLATDSMSEDHCYTSSSGTQQLAPWSENTSASAPLTPPESSEDEDASVHIPKSPPDATRKKAGLSEIENDRFNKVVKNTLLKNSSSFLKKTSRSITMSEAKTGKTKFRFLLTTQNKNSLLGPKCLVSRSEQRPGTTAYRLKSIKENKQMKRSPKASPSSSPSVTSSRKKARFEEVTMSNKGGRVDQREARNVHNQMERQRRTDLKNAFDSLKDFVPTIANSDRASKQMVLDKAIDYCKTLKSKEWTTREARRSLVQKNESLRKRLAEIESQMTSCQLENAAWEIQGW